VVNAIARAASECSRTLQCLSATGKVDFVLGAIWSLPACVRARKLAPLDRRMSGDYTVIYRGATLRIPVAEIDRLLAGTADSATFGTIREMLVNDVYLRAFRPLRAPTAVDLGSNRGFFLLIAAKVLGAHFAVGVEPLHRYDTIFDLLRDRNGIDGGSIIRHSRMIGAESAADYLTMGELVHKHKLQSIGFLKCDIEGAEFDLFTRNNQWLGLCDNIAMELHPAEGDTRKIVRSLNDYGFDCLTTDQFGTVTAVEVAEYLYASSSGDLLLKPTRRSRPRSDGSTASAAHETS
jgi:hypothetical protein